MNKTAIKNFAIDARNMLIQSAKQMAYEYEIEEGKHLDENQSTVGGEALSSTEYSQRRQLVTRIKELGFQNVMEEVAYTWFNRFTALRFMEVNGYLPSKVRVFTDDEDNFKPMILKEALTVEIDGLDREYVLELIDKQDNDTLYKYLLITQCNALNKCLPEMFEKFGGWTELLFPANLLREGSVINRMVDDIPEDDWKEQVQIIGWLYQYYNTEPKDKVFSRKSTEKIRKEDIPAATQLFTPDWIVRYMVENSLGRLWVDGHSDFDKSEWKYYLEEAEQEESVKAQLDSIKSEYKNISPEEIRFIDPCMGSGHILVYAFDVLMQIYVSQGWSERDAAVSIIENNLYGMDIDKRAYQLAYFALMMKGRSCNRRFLTLEIKPNLCYFSDIGSIDTKNISEPKLRTFAEMFNNADTIGSLLEVKPCDIDEIESLIENMELTMFNEGYQEKLKTMVLAHKILSQKYDVVTTNPPYMGGSGMNATLSDFVKKKFDDYKSDLFSAFIVRCTQMTIENGYLGFLTPYVWMFIQSYEKMRNYIYSSKTIETLIQFEYSAFEEATVPICTFVLKNSKVNINGVYLRLTDFRGGMEVQRQKTLEAIENHSCGFYYESNSKNFSKIPGSPVAYWVSENFVRAFENGKTIEQIANVPKGLSTGCVDRFMRFWFEIAKDKIDYSSTSCKDSQERGFKWFPYAKGGSYRRWNGNLEYVVNWENNGFEVKNFVDEKGKQRSRPQNTPYYFKEGITYSAITSGLYSVRYINKCIFGGGGDSIQTEDKSHLMNTMGFLNSTIAQKYLNVISPTMNFEVGHIKKLPIIINELKKPTIDIIVKENIELSKNDWDSFETSWDFERHPLMNGEKTIEKSFEKWSAECEQRFNKLKANEEELNRIFIDIYGLQDELTPEVEDKDVTVRKADLQREIKSLISYAVGCMFGRYSLDVKGLAYAGGEWESSKYKTFIPDEDNVLPILDDEYFEDDIVKRFVDFIKVVYGDETLEENLKFIADVLGGKGTPREAIRNYFLNGFYADHCKIYQKRPIYWLFDSGKKNGFKALMYIHRYKPDTVAIIRTDYVHETQERYNNQLHDIQERMLTASNADKRKLEKIETKFKDQLLELKNYEEKIHHAADMMIPLDLDDGVKVNYGKLQDVLAKIK